MRAELGNESVVRAQLREGHLPEGTFTWEPLDGSTGVGPKSQGNQNKLAAPKPSEVPGSMLVRRIFDRPIPLSSRSRQEPDGWMLRGLQQGPVIRVQGPYVVSGGWWRRSVHREYHFAETEKGEMLWIFFDRARRRWFMHGRVE